MANPSRRDLFTSRNTFRIEATENKPNHNGWKSRNELSSNLSSCLVRWLCNDSAQITFYIIKGRKTLESKCTDWLTCTQRQTCYLHYCGITIFLEDASRGGGYYVLDFQINEAIVRTKEKESSLCLLPKAPGLHPGAEWNEIIRMDSLTVECQTKFLFAQHDNL